MRRDYAGSVVDSGIRRRQRLKAALVTLLAVPAFGLAYRTVAFDGPFRPPGPPTQTPILDMHCHTACLGIGGSGCFVSKALQDNARFEIYLDAFGVRLSDVQEAGDGILTQRIAAAVTASERVGGAIILAMDGAIGADGTLDRSKTELYIPNAFVAEQVRPHDNLFFGASINPNRPDAVAQLHWAKNNGAVLIKWIPSIQAINPADPKHESFYRTMVELDLPLLTHAGQERSFTHAQDELCDPARLELPLQLGVRVIVAHAASTGENDGEEDFVRLLRLLRKYPKLYADISSLTQVNKLGYLRRVLEAPELRGRLLYGSDFPLTNTALVSAWYFPMNLSVTQMMSISEIDNPWDHDVALKEALGVPGSVLAQSAAFFGLLQ